MLCGRLIGRVIGAKVSSKAMVTTVASVAIIFVLLAILSPESIMVKMPVFQSDISFGLAQVPIGVMFLTLCGLCTSVMWGGIFNLSVEGLGKYTAAASGIFMVMVCGGGILPAIQGWIADVAGYMSSYWLVVAGFAYILFYALVGSKNVNKDIVTE
jgi:FHS family L-fucose permease-like MFS transporter